MYQYMINLHLSIIITIHNNLLSITIVKVNCLQVHLYILRTAGSSGLIMVTPCSDKVEADSSFGASVIAKHR